MDWIKQRWATLKEAVGNKRFAIDGIVAFVPNAILVLLAHLGVGLIPRSTAWSISVATLFALLFWWILDYATKLRNEMQPKFEVSPEVVTSTRKGTNEKFTWARFRIKQSSFGNVEKCAIRLTKIEKLNDDGSIKKVIFNAMLPLRWSFKQGTETTLYDDVEQTGDLIRVSENDDFVLLGTEEKRDNLREKIEMKTPFRFHFAITANKCRTIKKTMLFSWDKPDIIRFEEDITKQ